MAAWRPPEDEEVAWVLEVLGCKRSHIVDMSEDEFRYILKPRRKQVALALHPDKQDDERRMMAEAQMKRWNVAWERLMRSVPRQFKAAGVEFEDRRLSFEEWGKAEKEKLKSGESSVTDVLKRPAKVKGRINFP